MQTSPDLINPSMHGSLFSGKQSGYLREVAEKRHYEFQVGKKGIRFSPPGSQGLCALHS